MAQFIYLVVAVLVVMIVGMQMNRGAETTLQRQTLNEVATQLTGVGTEVLEMVGSTHFDRYTFANQGNRPWCGRTTSADSFSTAYVPSRRYIEGFVDLDTTLTRSDLDFRVVVDTVEYVSTVDYTTPSATPTFAKRVTVTAENPYLYLGDDPSNTFTLSMDRVFTYGCVTDPQYIPYVYPGDPCPLNTCTSRASL
ncbi:MAG: hypothetical protein R3181_06140 [Rubricoccaceae bacterium]|nr:hypothetical protein [Rubricoccaceae bacterium]